MENIYVKLAEKTVIHSERFLLRPFSLADTATVFEMTSDPETTQYLYQPHKSLADTTHYLATRFLRDPLGQYAIEEKATGKVIGSISFNRIDDTMRTAEIGYFLNKNLWNKGYMTELLKLMVQYGFEEFGFNSLMAVYDKRNQASAKVIVKVGFQYLYEDPYADKDILNPTEFVTDVFYRLTKEEYFNQKA